MKKAPRRPVVAWHFAVTTRTLGNGRDGIVRIEAERVPRAMPWARLSPHRDPIAILSCGHPLRVKEAAAISFLCRQCVQVERGLVSLAVSVSAAGATVNLSITPAGAVMLGWTWPEGEAHGFYLWPAGDPSAPDDWMPCTATQALAMAARAILRSTASPPRLV